MPQDMDHLGAAVQAQATHEAEMEELRAERDAAETDLASVQRDFDEVVTERDEIRAHRDDLVVTNKLLERLFARAIDAQVQAERARDDARAECQALLEKLRAK